MKKIIIWFFIILIFITGCSNGVASSSSSTTKSDSQKQSGYDLQWYAEQYFNIASDINRKIIEGDYESGLNLLDEAMKVVGNVKSLNVSSQYINAKNYLHNAIFYDSFSLLMTLDKGPKKDRDDAFSNSAYNIQKYVAEMRRLGHNMD